MQKKGAHRRYTEAGGTSGSIRKVVFPVALRISLSICCFLIFPCEEIDFAGAFFFVVRAASDYIVRRSTLNKQ